MGGNGKVFISYRRQDSSAEARIIYGAMAQRFGKDNVFFDLTSIGGGERWKQAITESLNETDVIVVIIGDRWTKLLTERQEKGVEDEHVFEIATAFDLDKRVVPILIDNTPMPAPEVLPSEIRDRLPQRNAKRIENDEWWDEKLQRILDEVQETIGISHAMEPPPPAGIVGEVTVGPRGSNTQFHEIADAVAHAKPGTRIRVAPGRYLKPVVIDRNVEIVADVRGEVRLEPETSPCLASSAADAGVIGLAITSYSPTGGEGVSITAGTLDMVDCSVRSEWPEHFSGLKATGDKTKVILEGCSFSAAGVGLHFSGGAGGQAERTTVTAVARHAVIIDQGADPQLVRCEFEGGDASALLIADHGKGTIGGCTLRTFGGPDIEVRTGGSPSVRSSVGGTSGGASGSASARTRLERLVDREHDRAEASGLTVKVVDGGEGLFRGCHLTTLETLTGGAPELEGCRIDAFDARDGGLGTLSNCVIGSATITTGANPRIQGGSRIHPELGRTIALTVADGGLGTVEDSEIVGIDVERKIDDPAVLISSDGNPTFVRCTITGPEAGTVRVSNQGRGRIERCEVSTSARNGAAVLLGASAGPFTLTESKVHGGVVVATGGAIHLDGCEIDAPKLGGIGISVLAGGEARVHACRIHDVATRGVVVAGKAALTGCEIRSTGSSAILVEGGGSLVAQDCRLGEAGRSAAQRVGRRLGALSDKFKDRAEKLVGPSRTIAVLPGGVAHFNDCTIEDDRDDPVDVPSKDVTFDGCTVNGEPYAGPTPD